jgi:hypothetical protein
MTRHPATGPGNALPQLGASEDVSRSTPNPHNLTTMRKDEPCLKPSVPTK